MAAPSLPDELRRAVGTRPEPVRPLAAPGRRALTMVFWVPAAALAILAALGTRHDAAVLGWPAIWALLVLEAGIGIVLVAMALAEAVPARGPSRTRAAAALSLAALAWGSGAFLTRGASPGLAIENPLGSSGLPCLALHVMIGLTGVALVAFLIASAAPLRAAWAGVLGGAGAGFMTEGVVHLHCAVTDLRHVLPWHGGALTTLAVVGLLGGLAWDLRERRGMRARTAGRRR